MKIYKFKLISFILMCIFSFSLISAFPFKSSSKTLIVLDSDSSNPLPDRFRDLTNLNISGSAQFTPNQIKNIKSSINQSNICIVDLRQESHGFINDIAISFYAIDKDLNNGFSTEETINTENKLLNEIKINSKVNIYDKLGKIIKDVTVASVSNEEKLVKENNLQYKRFAVKDGSIPDLTVVDNFVDFIKDKPEDLHLHFHCDAGEGRTTTFMALYQIMNNDNNLSLDQILSYQYNMGGIILTNDSYRSYFLNTFYTYVENNKSTNYSTPFSTWVQNN